MPALNDGRQNARNVLSRPVGVRGEAKNFKSPKQIWDLFFSADLLSHIVKMINKNITAVGSTYVEKFLDRTKQCYIGLTNFRKVLAFVGSLYLRGL